MISVSLCASSSRMRAMHGMLRCGSVVALLLCRTLAAQTAPADLQDTLSPPSACDSPALDIPHSDALRKVCQYAVTLPQLMPNFTCEQKTLRFRDEHAADTVTAIVTYEDGKESYRDVRSNGQPVTDARWLNSGTWSTGQFGVHIRGLFDTGNTVTFKFVNQSQVNGKPVLTFEYQVPHQDVPFWRLHVDDQMVAPPYHGQLWIDQHTGNLLQLNVVATEIPPNFPLRNADLQISYDNVQFADGTSFVLPLKSVVNGADNNKRHNRNVLEFRNCHKFRATARIVPQ